MRSGQAKGGGKKMDQKEAGGRATQNKRVTKGEGG